MLLHVHTSILDQYSSYFVIGTCLIYHFYHIQSILQRGYQTIKIQIYFITLLILLVPLDLRSIELQFITIRHINNVLTFF